MASVFLNDLANDYLNPSSQGCINPLFTEDDNEESKASSGAACRLPVLGTWRNSNF